jgi:hypothetical protein
MIRSWKATAAGVLALVLLVAAGCGGADRTKAQVRLVNASSGYAQLDLSMAGQQRFAAVTYGASAGYVEVDPDDSSASISSTGSATTLVNFTAALSAKKHYTVLAYGAAGALRHVVLDDNTSAPETGKALLRVINTATDAGSMDVYLTAPDEPLVAAVPVQSGAVAGTLGSAITVNSGNWQLRVTAAGSKTDVRLNVPVVALPSRHVATLVLTPGARIRAGVADGGGVLVGALVLAQQGPITQEDARHARVRLAALMADSGTVDATVGAVTLAAGAASPSVDSYKLVPVGVSAVSVRANGLTLVTPAKTLDPGREYTLMVYGPLTGGSAVWLEDDNRLPADSTKAKLRLINGLSDSSAPLAMTLNVRSVASGVLAGTASSYAPVEPTTGTGTDGALSITASGFTTPLFTGSGQVLLANTINSVVLAGPVAAPAAFVFKDR